mgnify:FL=1
MKCKKCGKKAAMAMPQHEMALCADCYDGWFPEYTQRTINEFHMMTERDRVLVCVSGGKDSIALWDVLVRLGYDVLPMHVTLGMPCYSEASMSAVRELAERTGQDPIVVDVEQEVDFTIPEVERYSPRSPCSACGAIKRHYMNRVAREQDCTVVATGHNLDDEASRLFMNTLSWDTEQLAHQQPVSPATQGLVKKVRPFCFISERQTAAYAITRDLPWTRQECPHSSGANTNEYRLLLAQLEDNHPGIKRQFYNHFLRERHRFESDQDLELHQCERCGMPTTCEVCAFCRLVEQVQEAKAEAAS